MIAIYEGGRVTDRLYVSGGFAEITPERCTVLGDEAIPTADLSRAEGDRRLGEAEAAYQAADKMDVPALDAVMDRLQSAPRDDRGCHCLSVAQMPLFLLQLRHHDGSAYL